MERLFHLQFGCQRHSRSALPDGKGRDDAESFGTGGGAGGGAGGALGAQERAGAVWALDGLFEPVAVRFQYHFEEDKPTNRIDREYDSSALVVSIIYTYSIHHSTLQYSMAQLLQRSTLR